MRELTDAETRGGLYMMATAVEFARATVAMWAAREEEPSHGDMIKLAISLGGALAALDGLGAQQEPTDGHSLDDLAEIFAASADEIKKQVGQNQ